MTTQIAREEIRLCHIGYSFRLAARVLLYASSHRHDNTYHSLCYASRGALARTRNSSMSPPHEGPIAPSAYHGATSCSSFLPVLWLLSPINSKGSIKYHSCLYISFEALASFFLSIFNFFCFLSLSMVLK